MCKGLGMNAAKHLEKNQPYNDIKDLVEKTDPSIVDVRVIDALIVNGYMGKKAQKNKEHLIEKFIVMRKDFKLISKKGVQSIDIFK
jgi:DNA polymerase III alpha subunit